MTPLRGLALAGLLLVACACTTPPQLSARQLFERGVAHAKADRFDEAIADHERALAVEPAYAQAARGIGDARYNKKEYAAAVAAYTRAIELDPTYAYVYSIRGAAHRQLGQYGAAMADHDRAVGLGPTDARNFVDRAHTWARQGNWLRALQDYEHARRMAPGTPSYQTLGLIRFYLGHHRAAAEEFRQAAQESLDDGYVSLWGYLSRVRAGDDAQAAHTELARHRALLRGDAWPRPVIDFYLGRTDETSLLNAAAAAPKTAASPDPVCETAFYLGQQRMLQGDRPGAREHFARAVRDCPRDFTEYRGAQAELNRESPSR
jgi:lipoprotein NlpI